MRKLYRTRCQELILQLSMFGDQLQISGEGAGLFLVVQLQNGLTENQMCQRAKEKGIQVYPISPYFNGPVPKQHQSKVLLGFGAINQTQIQQGVELLYQAWNGR